MALEEIDITASGSISGTTISADTVVVGGNVITLTNAHLPSLTATTLSAGTIFSGSTDLYNIFPRKSVGVVYINSASDFPTPVGGIIYLSANTQYLVSGTINVGNPFRIDGGKSDIIGKDKYLDKIVYSGSGNMFNIRQPSFFYNIGIEAPSATNIFSGVMSTNDSFRLESSNFNNCQNIGSISGGLFTTINDNSFTNITGNGFTFISTRHLRYELNDHEFGYSGTTLYVNSGLYEAISISGNYINLPFSGIGINIHTGTTFTNNSGGGLINGNTIVGITSASTSLSGIQHYDSNWEIQGNLNISDSEASGEMYFNGNATPTVLAVNVWTRTAGTTTSGTNEQFTMSGSNVLRYTGKRTKEGVANVSLSISSVANNQTLQASIYKNGVQIPSSVCEMRTSTASQSVSGSLHAILMLTPNDYFELYIRNITASSNATVEFMNFVIE